MSTRHTPRRSVLFAPLRDGCYGLGLPRRPSWHYPRPDFVDAFELMRMAAEYRGARLPVSHTGDAYVFRRSLCNRLNRVVAAVRSCSDVLADELAEFETRVVGNRVTLCLPKGDWQIDTEPLVEKSVTRLAVYIFTA